MELNYQLIKSGTWIFAESVTKQVHIIKSNFKAGSGDYQDASSVREDQFGEFYGVIVGEFEPIGVHSGGDYETLQQAITYAEFVCPSLVWRD
ncbi:MAG: hypothetical protein ACPG8A_00500 [Psychrobium sp.]